MRFPAPGRNGPTTPPGHRRAPRCRRECACGAGAALPGIAGRPAGTLTPARQGCGHGDRDARAADARIASFSANLLSDKAWRVAGRPGWGRVVRAEGAGRTVGRDARKRLRPKAARRPGGGRPAEDCVPRRRSEPKPPGGTTPPRATRQGGSGAVREALPMAPCWTLRGTRAGSGDASQSLWTRGGRPGGGGGAAQSTT